MISRRNVVLTSIGGFFSSMFLRAGSASAQTQPPNDPVKKPLPPARARDGRTLVETPDGWTLPYRMEGGVKVFHIIAEQVQREFVNGLTVNCWGYNGTTPGPTIEAIEGDRVRILLENRLPESTSMHWHGFIIPNGMDGVGGLNQPKIRPGETFAYEFTLKQTGSLMYHPHFDEMSQVALGMQGFFIIHPRNPRVRRVDRDFAIFLHEWFIKPGAATPDPTVMLDFNTFTFNSRVFPGTSPMTVRTGDRVRIRLANLTMNSHPIHIHGHRFYITGTDAGPLPESAWWAENTVNVPVGTTRDIEFTADNPGDWAFHCHKSHHTMNQMGHDLPNVIGAELRAAEERLNRVIPGTMLMGNAGMGEMSEHQKGLPIPRNSIPMLGGVGPYGAIDMGGMFTIVKVRDAGDNSEWYRQPPGTVAWKVGGTAAPAADEHSGHGGS